ncbi:cell division transport system permease protein [Cohaesibacter sp. ES.047]|uniref:cell division protein FtsX n=1 Tax=Cohaesibacter sp. ES.047 TaxID=1798205 RepID=UPI000BBF88E5|nr:ABC transporter permease [Cohaesibacter sp. ES.047]SNY90805.1 cell division transport system permease protein [Cohaesibacter sp. ES.047]
MAGNRKDPDSPSRPPDRAPERGNERANDRMRGDQGRTDQGNAEPNRSAMGRDELGRPHAPLPHAAPVYTPVPSGQQRMGPNIGRVGQEAFAPSPDIPREGVIDTSSRAPARPLPKKEKKKKAKSQRKSGQQKVLATAANFAIGNQTGPIVPKGTIAGHALVLVIAIMSFLAALTVAAVAIISDATHDWQSDISRGATIQIRKIEGIDIEAELAKAVRIARETPGIGSATLLSQSESGALLEPWLGLDLAFDDLPVPRLIELTIADPDTVDFPALSESLQQQVTGAILDNHRFWVDRLKSMADTAIMIGFTILFLVIAATILTVIFATRSAMSGNRETIEVLHFVGASNKFIAGEFQRKFFTLGFKGSLAGGAIAIVIFLFLQLLVRQDEGSAASDQMQALLGVIQLGYAAYLGTFALILLIAIFTAITTRLTVMNTLSKLA